MHACMHAYVHTYIHTYTDTYIHPHMHSCIRFGVARQTENYQLNGHNFKICLSNMTLCKFQMLGKGEQILVSVKKCHVKTSELTHTQKPIVKSSLRKKFAEPGQVVAPAKIRPGMPIYGPEALLPYPVTTSKYTFVYYT